MCLLGAHCAHCVGALDRHRHSVQARRALFSLLIQLAKLEEAELIWCMKRVLSFSENWAKFQNVQFYWLDVGKGCRSTGGRVISRSSCRDELTTISHTASNLLSFFSLSLKIIAQPVAMRLILAQLLRAPESYLPLITLSFTISPGSS